MKSLQKRTSRGFTMVELLVSMLIMSIIFAGGAANYRRYSQRQAVTKVSDELRSQFLIARSKALAGEKPGTGANPCRPNSTSRLEYYVVNMSTTSTNLNYTMQAVCETQTITVKTGNIAIPNGTTVTYSPNSYVRFNAVDGTSTGITVTITGSATTTNVAVQATGEIN